MSVIRVVQLISTASVGGSESMLRSNAARYSSDRMTVTVVNFAPGDVPDAWWREFGANYLAFPERPPTPASARRLYSYLVEHKPDVVDIYGLRTNLVARPVARAAGVPVITSNVRGLDDWRKWYHVWADRLTSGWVDMYVANSEAASRVCRDREGIPDHKRIVIHTGIDLEACAVAESPQQIRRSIGVSVPSTIIFLTAASFRPQKAHHVLIEAIRQRRNDLAHCEFWLAGDGPLREEVESQVQQAGLCGQVRFLGLRTDIARLLHAADAFVLPSAFESLPRSIIEAMAAGKPVISTRVGGIPELIEHGRTGLLVPPGEPGALGEALVRLASEPENARGMGIAGRKRAEGCFDIRRALTQTEHLFRQLVDRKSRRCIPAPLTVTE